MTTLQRNALGRLAMTEIEVQALYDQWPGNKCVRALCESHERLRTELQGAEIMLAEAVGLEEKLAAAEKKLADLQAQQPKYGKLCGRRNHHDTCTCQGEGGDR